MECRASLVHEHLVSPGLDPDEVRYGQLLTLRRHPGGPAGAAAIVTLSTMIGVMTLARITSDSPLSKEILDRVKEHLH
jgi:hypothetical protein